MDFNKAFEAMNNGKKIRRPGMKNGAFLYRFNNVIFMEVEGKGTHSYGVQCDDLIAKDWDIVEDIPETYMMVRQTTVQYFICPKCGKECSTFDELAHKICGACNTKVKLVPRGLGWVYVENASCPEDIERYFWIAKNKAQILDKFIEWLECEIKERDEKCNYEQRDIYKHCHIKLLNYMGWQSR